MKKISTFLMMLFLVVSTVWAQNGFSEENLLDIETGSYFVYHTDANGVKHYLQLTQEGNVVTVTENPETFGFAKKKIGNYMSDNSGKYSIWYRMSMNGKVLSNTSQNSGNIETKVWNGGSNDMDWAVQPIFVNSDGKAAIRLTNATDENSSWHGHWFVGLNSESQPEGKEPSAENLFIWTIEKENLYPVRLIAKDNVDLCLQIVDYNKSVGNGQGSEGALQFKPIVENETSQLFYLQSVDEDDKQYYLKNVNDGIVYYLYANQWNYFASTTKKTPLTIKDDNKDGAFTIYQVPGDANQAGYLGNKDNVTENTKIYSDQATGHIDWFFTLPVNRGFYTISSGGKYVNDDRFSESETQRTTTTELTAKNIFYYDGKALIGYSSGFGFEYAVCNTKKPQEMNNFLFLSEGENCKVKSFEGTSVGGWADGYYWNVHSDNYLERVDLDKAGLWNLEEVTSLPVTITEAGYATFYAPVAVTVPAGVTAHTVTVNGEWATLNEIEGGVIPANTGVVLSGEANTYNLTITEATETIESGLEGTVASTYITKEAYALGYINVAEQGQPEQKEVGFFTAKMTNGQWLNNGFKAYLPKVTENKTLRFNFGGNTTGIEDAIVAPTFDANAPIYDLSGRRVVNAVKGGLYIQNGKKFIVK